jgi:hypothetical protein
MVIKVFRIISRKMERVLRHHTRPQSGMRRRAKEAWVSVRHRLTGHSPVTPVDTPALDHYDCTKNQEMLERLGEEIDVEDGAHSLAPSLKPDGSE